MLLKQKTVFSLSKAEFISFIHKIWHGKLYYIMYIYIYTYSRPYPNPEHPLIDKRVPSMLHLWTYADIQVWLQSSSKHHLYGFHSIPLYVYNVVKTIINHPPVITIDRCYVYHSQVGSLWHCFNHIIHHKSPFWMVQLFPFCYAVFWFKFPGSSDSCSLQPASRKASALHETKLPRYPDNQNL